MPVCSPDDKTAEPCMRCFAGFPRHCMGLVDAPCFDCVRGILHQCYEKVVVEDVPIASSLSLVSGDSKHTVCLPLVAECTKTDQEDAVVVAGLEEKRQSILDAPRIKTEQGTANNLKFERESDVAKAENETGIEDVSIVSSRGLVSEDLKTTVFFPLVAGSKKAKDIKEYGSKSGEISAVGHKKPSVAMENKEKKAEAEPTRATKGTPLPLHVIAAVAANKVAATKMNPSYNDGVNTIVPVCGLVSGNIKYTAYRPLVAEYKKRPEMEDVSRKTVHGIESSTTGSRE